MPKTSLEGVLNQQLHSISVSHHTYVSHTLLSTQNNDRVKYTNSPWTCPDVPLRSTISENRNWAPLTCYVVPITSITPLWSLFLRRVVSTVDTRGTWARRVTASLVEISTKPPLKAPRFIYFPLVSSSSSRGRGEKGPSRRRRRRRRVAKAIGEAAGGSSGGVGSRTSRLA
jgi:hypothetical protein